VTRDAPPRERPAVSREGLVRGIGFTGLAASVVNCTVGAGIFVLPAAVALHLGAAAPLAFLLCFAVMTLVVACFALAGSRVSTSGGAYGWVEHAFGSYAAFLAGWLLWVSDILACSGIAAALSASASVLVPFLGAGAGRTAFILLLIGGLGLVNLRGVRSGVGLVKALTALKLLPLLLLVAAGAFAITPANLAWPGLPPARDLGDTVLLLIFAFVGVEVALAPSGEVKDPARTVPRAVFAALAVTTLLYVALQMVAQGVLGPALSRFPEAPLAEAAARVLGSWGRALLVVGASVSMLGYLGGSLLGSPRTLFAFGRDGIAPVLALLHPRFRTPWAAILTHAGIAAALAISGTFEVLVLLSNVAVLALYGLCAVATFALVRRDVRREGEPFRFPGDRAVPLVAAGAVLWVLASATAREVGVLAGVVAAGSLLYGLRRPRPSGGDVRRARE
jgi:APA family basic amino acid/polyamine antiporter